MNAERNEINPTHVVDYNYSLFLPERSRTSFPFYQGGVINYKSYPSHENCTPFGLDPAWPPPTQPLNSREKIGCKDVYMTTSTCI